MKRNITLAISSIFFTFTLSSSQSIRPAKPTHLMYTPTPYVNPEYHLVLGFHEISFALPERLQFQASIFDNIGRINFGAKYGFRNSNMAIGLGMAYSLIHLGDGVHGIPSFAKPRLGSFLAIGVVGNKSSKTQFNITPHTQIGDYISLGADFGLLHRPHAIWSLMWEVGTSISTWDGGTFYLNTNGGIRMNFPQIKFMFFDLGIDLTEFALNRKDSPSVSPFIDITFAMITK